jgi:hypothetical protein
MAALISTNRPEPDPAAIGGLAHGSKYRYIVITSITSHINKPLKKCKRFSK